MSLTKAEKLEAEAEINRKHLDYSRSRQFAWTSSIAPLIVASELRLRRNRPASDSWRGHRSAWNLSGRMKKEGKDNIFKLPPAAINPIINNPKWVKAGVDLYNSITKRPASVEEAGGISAHRGDYLKTFNGHIYWIHGNIVWICEKPSVELRVKQQLHCDNGPALKWSDGFELYFLQGSLVPKALVMNPDKININDILSQRNAEVVRLILEKMTPEKFVEMAKAKIIDQDEVESKTVKPIGKKLVHTPFIDKRTLYEIPLPKLPDRVARLLYLECPSTGHKVLLGVPPRIKDVKDAVMWVEKPPRAGYEMVLET